MNLTNSQKEAIESWKRGDVSVVAGPGSGKTTVLVEHFRWLVEQRGVNPRRILAITFTEKAANSMHERLVREAPTPDLRQEFERAQISTIDAFCNRLLREHAIEIGLDPDFRIMDPSEQEVETRRVVDEVLNEVFQSDPAVTFEFLSAFAGSNRHAEEFHISHVHDQLYQLYVSIRAWDAKAFARENDQAEAYRTLLAALKAVAKERESRPISGLVQSAPPAVAVLGADHFEWLTNVEQTIAFMGKLGKGKKLPNETVKDLTQAVQAARFSACYNESRQWVVRVSKRIGEAYLEWKRANSTLDFSDLVERAVQFLESQPELRSQFHHILIDEYQDTNTSQAKLARLLRGDPQDSSRVLFAVGDVNQSIYGFRHADPEVFRDYREQVKRDGGHLVDLRENFRSRPEILRVVETILSHADGIEARDLIAGEQFAVKSIPSVEVLIARGSAGEDSAAAEEREALHTAARIFELHEILRVGQPPRPVRWSDFAILLRTHDLVSRFAATLRKAGVPYQLSAGRGFFESSEVRDLVNFLKVLRNPRDEIALAAVLRSPLAGLSDEALLRIKLDAFNLAEALRKPPQLDPEDAQKLDRFRERFDHYRRTREDLPADLMLSRLLSECGYEAWLLNLPGGLQQAANVQKLLSIVRALRRDRELSFSELVERLEELQQVGTPETEATVQDSAEDAVHLLTMHAAKGLEFPVVFLPALQRGQRFDSDPLLFSPQDGIGVSWLDAATGESAGDAAYLAVRERLKRQEKEEINRLLYVAMTRAKEHLVLSLSFGATVRAEQWAQHLRENLKIDLKQTDDQPQVQEVNGCRFRLFRTSRDPETLRPVLEHPQETGIAWVERVAPASQPDSEAAVTSVALFADCPRRYYLSRYLGFAEARLRSGRGRIEPADADDALPAEPDETDATELGRLVHAVLAGSLPIERASGEALRMVENFQASSLGQQTGAAEAVVREQHLTFALDGHLLRGQLDLWFDHEGRRVLVDYKTDQVSAEEARERLRTYALQLQLYSLALQRAGGRRPDQAVAYFLRPNIALDVDLSPPALEHAQETVRRFFAAQAEVEFSLDVGEHCLRCPHYHGLCPARLPSAAARTDAPQPPAEPPQERPARPKKSKADARDRQLALPFQDGE